MGSLLQAKANKGLSEPLSGWNRRKTLLFLLWLFEHWICASLQETSNSREFSSNRSLMEPLVWIPSLASFKCNGREGCKTQLGIRGKRLSPPVGVWNLWFLWLPFLLLLFLPPVLSFTVLQVYAWAEGGVDWGFFYSFFFVFLVETSILSFTSCSQLAMRMDSRTAQAEQFESRDTTRYPCDRGTSNRTCLMDSRRWTRKAKTRKGKKKNKTLYADLSSCVIFTLLIKTNSPSIAESSWSLLWMTSPRASPVDNLMHY